MSIHLRAFALFFLLAPAAALADGLWKGHRAAVVLTYDDALDTHLNKVLPELDRRGLPGTFYLTLNAEAFRLRMEDWRRAASRGHELGNHTLFHPCDSSLPGREWVAADYDLHNYTRQRILDEIRLTNKILESLDGQATRTYAYTCGDRKAGGEDFVDGLHEHFVAARGVSKSFTKIDHADLFDINAYVVEGQQGQELIAQVEEALRSETLVVFLFHGVGGKYPIEASLEAHNQLLDFLAKKREQTWVTTLRDAGEFLQARALASAAD